VLQLRENTLGFRHNSSQDAIYSTPKPESIKINYVTLHIRTFKNNNKTNSRQQVGKKI
jgi:hypothetical protein